MNDEMKKKRDDKCEEICNDNFHTGDDEIRDAAKDAFCLGFDACHELMQAKLDVAVQALEWYSEYVWPELHSITAKKALEKLK